MHWIKCHEFVGHVVLCYVLEFLALINHFLKAGYLDNKLSSYLIASWHLLKQIFREKCCKHFSFTTSPFNITERQCWVEAYFGECWSKLCCTAF